MKAIHFIIHGLFVCFLTFLLNLAEAQKLPDIQSNGFRVSIRLKMDGKIDEWESNFQAYNKANQIFYTIANDDENLYLMLHVANNTIIRKVVTGGITFFINPNKKDKNGVAITFPKYNKFDPPLYLLFSYKPSSTETDLEIKAEMDSVRRNYNSKISERAKLIGVKGISAIIDSDLSIYNEEEIKAFGKIDAKLAYNYELAIPLKYLGIQPGHTTQLYYYIQLNGIAVDGTNIRPLNGRDKYIYTRADGKDHELGNAPEILDLIYPTSFGGRYTIAK
jgi:hypothetical protein